MSEMDDADLAKAIQGAKWTPRFSFGKSDPSRCCASIPDGGRMVTSHQCTRPGKVERLGHKFCAQHDPVAAKARHDKKIEQWRQERAAKNRAYAERQRQEALQRAALVAIRQIADGHNDPRALALSVLAPQEPEPS